MAYRFFQNGKKGLGLSKMLLLSALSFILIQLVGLHPGILIATFLISAFFIASRKEKAENNPPKDEVELKEKSS
jgi:chromate transporter